jgi:hypothetical protein
MEIHLGMFNITDDVNLYVQSSIGEEPDRNADYIFEINGLNIFRLQYQENSINSNLVDVTFSVQNTERLIDGNDFAIKAGGGSSMSNFINPTNMKECVMSVIATEIFGNPRARAAIENDGTFITRAGEFADHINTQLVTLRNDIFNLYVDYMGTTLPANDINTPQNIDLTATGTLLHAYLRIESDVEASVNEDLFGNNIPNYFNILVDFQFNYV